MDRNLLPAISAFCQLAKHGSFTLASEVLGVSPSALSQTMRMLEEKLNVRLLNRTTRSISLTEEGQIFLKQVEPALKSIEYAAGVAGESLSNPSGEIRINTSRVAARLLIEPHLKEFYKLHPQIHIELVMDDGIGDIVQDGCDAGIRLRESVLDSMVAIPLSPDIQMAVVGSPEYFKNHPVPKTPSDLNQHNCLRFRPSANKSVYHWEFTNPQKPHQDILFEPKGSLTTNDELALIRMAVDDIGLIIHFDLAVNSLIANGSLVRVLDSWSQPWPGFNLYMPSRAQMPAKMRAFIDFFTSKKDFSNKKKNKKRL